MWRSLILCLGICVFFCSCSKNNVKDYLGGGYGEVPPQSSQYFNQNVKYYRVFYYPTKSSYLRFQTLYGVHGLYGIYLDFEKQVYYLLLKDIYEGDIFKIKLELKRGFYFKENLYGNYFCSKMVVTTRYDFKFTIIPWTKKTIKLEYYPKKDNYSQEEGGKYSAYLNHNDLYFPPLEEFKLY